jgi:hypothetical protein
MMGGWTGGGLESGRTEEYDPADLVSAVSMILHYDRKPVAYRHHQACSVERMILYWTRSVVVSHGSTEQAQWGPINQRPDVLVQNHASTETSSAVGKKALTLWVDLRR